MPAFNLEENGLEIVEAATEKIWNEWASLIIAERWMGCDLTDQLVGFVTWNETDRITYIGAFLVIPELRGKGLGYLLWQKAKERFPQGCSQMLQSSPGALQFYREQSGMDGWQNQMGYVFQWKALVETMETFSSSSDASFRMCYVSDLTDAQFNKLLEFDRFVTGRDRSIFLKIHYGIDLVEGLVLFDEQDKVCAIGSITPTDIPENHIYRMAPVYAEEKNVAVFVITKLAERIGNREPKSRIVIQLLDGTQGDIEFAEIFKSGGKCEVSHAGKTIFNGEINNPIQNHFIYIANNNTTHFDI